MNNVWLRKPTPLFFRSGGPEFTSEGYLRGPPPGTNMPFKNGHKHATRFAVTFTAYCLLGLGAPAVLSWFSIWKAS